MRSCGSVGQRASVHVLGELYFSPAADPLFMLLVMVRVCGMMARYEVVVVVVVPPPLCRPYCSSSSSTTS